MKREAVRVGSFLVLEGEKKEDVALALGITPRTLLNWERRGAEPLPLRGRPRAALDPPTRAAIIERIEEVGPTLGVAPLKRLFLRAPRRAITDLLIEERARYAREHAYDSLTWRRPGAVWAMDHAKAPRASGAFSIFAVKDLGSGDVLHWKRSPETAEEVTRELKLLIDSRGAPLVLKSDRGPAFTAHLLGEFLDSRGIVHLLSPPRCPRYNGTIEATIRWLKLATMHQAVLSGDALVWTPDALEKAKGITNTVRRSRERALAEGTSSRWPVITDGERAHFKDSVRGFEEMLLEQGGLALEGAGAIDRRSPARRQAIERALVAHAILHITRRAIPLRIRSRPWEKIG